MRLLLASNGLGALGSFLSQAEKRGLVAFIPTAAAPSGKHESIEREQQVLRRLGCRIESVDISNLMGEALREMLDAAQLIFVSGGDPFYLLAKARESSFAKYLCDELPRGRSYVGVSAGALLVGPSLEPCLGLGGIPERYGLDSLDCLGLVDFFTLSHSRPPITEPQERHIIDTYGDHYRIIRITDQQAIRVENGDHEIVSSPQEMPRQPDD